MGDRIQKIIASSGFCSRRAAEKLIAEGRVRLDGRTVLLGETSDGTDGITIDGQPLSEIGKRTYILLNKPRGYVCTMSDEKGRRSVADLTADVGARVVPVGRLDMDSEGLLIMTDDGELAARLTHPSHMVKKTYSVRVLGKVRESAVNDLRGLRELGGEPIRPAEVKLLRSEEPTSLLLITITEGKNRQVRRMCAAVGLQVLRLKRISEGNLTLGDLPPGKWRYLNLEEIENLQKPLG
ncbi:MAG: rRNA pseudouridine synthase [Clostridiales bacterium]|nr:rRNA pseudouridine synthase [Clostridiales bacterium]